MTAAVGARNLFKVDTGVVHALLQARYYDGSKGEFLSEHPIPNTKETAPAPSEALFAELSVIDQTACRHTARLVPNFSALETPARSVQGFLLSGQATATGTPTATVECLRGAH